MKFLYQSWSSQQNLPSSVLCQSSCCCRTGACASSASSGWPMEAGSIQCDIHRLALQHLPGEHYALRFILNRVFLPFACWEYKYIVSKYHCTIKDTNNVRPQLGFSQDDQEIVYIGCEEDAGADSALSNAILHREHLGILPVPPAITVLVAVYQS